MRWVRHIFVFKNEPAFNYLMSDILNIINIKVKPISSPKKVENIIFTYKKVMMFMYIIYLPYLFFETPIDKNNVLEHY